MQKDGYSDHNQVSLVPGGQAYFHLLGDLIGKAQEHIFLQYYIFSDDETGQQVAEQLKQAALRGVKVFLMVDGYASQKLPQQFAGSLRETGIRFRWFEPLFKSRKFYFGRRMHHKVLVVDGRYGLVGGINISNRYNDMPHQPAWKDMAIFCKGSACIELLKICRGFWGKAASKIETPVTRDGDTETGRQWVRVRSNDWVKRKNQVTKTYLYMLLNATQEITIMCSYFLPGRVFRREISNAAKRGVRIRVILAGPSDVMMAKHAERYLYDWLLKNRILVYEYQKTVLHAKMAVCDGNFVTVGSYNVNNISAYASLELNLDVKDDLLAMEAAGILDHIILEECKQVTLETHHRSRNFFRKTWEWFCYRFINSVLSLFTFYFKQEE